MKLNININIDEYCNILITDNSIYQDENDININPSKLKFLDTVSIVTIIHQDTREDKLKYYYIDKHNSRFFKVPITFDGVFVIQFVVVPTIEWYNKSLKSVSKEDLIQAFGGKLSIWDGQQILEITVNSKESVPILEFIEDTGYSSLSVNRYKEKLLSTSKLRKCYVNLCQKIFNDKNFSSCQSKNKVDNELIYKRDLIWMTINVITYLWQLGNSDLEIASLLKQVNKCNGLCSPYPDDSIIINNNGCGCSGK